MKRCATRAPIILTNVCNWEAIQMKAQLNMKIQKFLIALTILNLVPRVLGPNVILHCKPF